MSERLQGSFGGTIVDLEPKCVSLRKKVEKRRTLTLLVCDVCSLTFSVAIQELVCCVVARGNVLKFVQVDVVAELQGTT